MPAAPRIEVAIVSHDSAPDLPACLAAAAALTGVEAEIVVVDSASGDGSVEAARRSAPASSLVRVVALADNVGFAAAMNRALEESDAPWVLSLNPDARPRPDYAERLLARAAAHPDLSVGAVTGRLSRFSEPGGAPRLDACGMRLTPTWRHLDRGSGRRDRGQYDRPERVFGGTGAATLFRRAALEDVAVDGEVFASLFHSFREDAELCFRLAERGWAVLYEPAARARHRRLNLPTRRDAMPAAVNFHSLKNRYLLRAWHQTPANLLITLPATLPRDLLALGWCLLRDRRVLAAYPWLWRHRGEIWARRRSIRARRTAPASAVERWFLHSGRPL